MFSQELTAGNVKAAMKDAGAVSADLWQVPVDQLRILPGFNVRERTEKYEERVAWITGSIMANGYNRKYPLEGYVAKEAGRDVVYITGGHRRHEAVHRAIKQGAPLERVPVIVSPSGTSIEALTVDLALGNEGEPLTVYERSTVCQRLAAFGWASGEIARKLGYTSAQYVDDLLTLAGAPLALRKMVIAEVVSATSAIDAIKKHGEKAAEVLATAMVKAAGGRVTAKHLPDAAFKKSLKKQAEPMYIALTKLQVDPGFAKLSKDTRDELAAILGSITK